MSVDSTKRKLVISCERLLWALYHEKIISTELTDALFFLPHDYMEQMDEDLKRVYIKYQTGNYSIMMNLRAMALQAIKSAERSGRLALHDPSEDGWQQLNDFLRCNRDQVIIPPAGPFTHLNVVLSALDEAHGDLPYDVIWENQEKPLLV